VEAWSRKARQTQLAHLGNSVTGRCLAEPLKHSRSRRRAVHRETPMIEISGAVLHNLRTLDARIPKGRLSVITGVSGSGKSSLARDVLLSNLKRLLSRPSTPTRARKSRSRCWAAMTLPDGNRSAAFWRSINAHRQNSALMSRDLYRFLGFHSQTVCRHHRGTHARIHRQPFFVQYGGRPLRSLRRSGDAAHRDEFLPDVQVLCDVCGGKRFNPETLSILFKGRNIGEILAMSVEDALEFFSAQRSVHHPLSLLADVGLGYLSLVNPARRCRAEKASASSW